MAAAREHGIIDALRAAGVRVIVDHGYRGSRFAARHLGSAFETGAALNLRAVAAQRSDRNEEAAALLAEAIDLAVAAANSWTLTYIRWQGGFTLESSGWANRTTSVRNNEQYTLTLLDGRDYHDCVILDTVAPGESKTLSTAADNKTDIVDWSSGPDSCDPL